MTRIDMMPAYKDKKKGTWYVALYYKDWTGVTKHTCKRGFKTKGEAVAYERNILSSLEHTTDIPFAAKSTLYVVGTSSYFIPTGNSNPFFTQNSLLYK